MESQEELKIGIGNEEASASLKPETVKVLSVKIEPVKTKKGESKKLVVSCKHSAKEEPISISEVKYENKGKLDTIGLWFNLDSKKMIKKGSALAVFMQSVGVANIEALVGKDIVTTTDDAGYLCFKAY